MGFSKKKDFYSNSKKVAKIAVECLSEGIISWKSPFRPIYGVFWQKVRKASNVRKVRKYDEEKRFSWKKLFSSFQKLFSQNWEGAKYAGGGRPSCWSYVQQSQMTEIVQAVAGSLLTVAFTKVPILSVLHKKTSINNTGSIKLLQHICEACGQTLPKERTSTNRQGINWSLLNHWTSCFMYVISSCHAINPECERIIRVYLSRLGQNRYGANVFSHRSSLTFWYVPFLYSFLY